MEYLKAKFIFVKKTNFRFYIFLYFLYICKVIFFIYKMKLIKAPLLVKIITFGFATAITLYPFIFISKNEKEYGSRFKILLNHEKIHIEQQKELYIFGFYFLYLFFYFINLIKTKKHYVAYNSIPFERESFCNENNLKYLSERKKNSWKKYFR